MVTRTTFLILLVVAVAGLVHGVRRFVGFRNSVRGAGSVVGHADNIDRRVSVSGVGELRETFRYHFRDVYGEEVGTDRRAYRRGGVVDGRWVVVAVWPEIVLRDGVTERRIVLEMPEFATSSFRNIGTGTVSAIKVSAR